MKCNHILYSTDFHCLKNLGFVHLADVSTSTLCPLRHSDHVWILLVHEVADISLDELLCIAKLVLLRSQLN